MAFRLPVLRDQHLADEVIGFRLRRPKPLEIWDIVVGT